MTVQLHFQADDVQALKSIGKINTGIRDINTVANSTNKSLKGLGKVDVTSGTRSLDKMSVSLQNLDKRTKDATNSFKMLAISAGAFATITFGAKSFLQAGDALASMENRLGLFIDNASELKKVKEQLYDIANLSGSAIDTPTQVFSRLSMTNLSKSFDKDTLLQLTETLNLAAGVTGGPAADAALIQLSQAFSNNFSAAAQELNSINEGAPFIARVIADGLGVSSDKLKKMAEDGELTAQKVAKAILSQSEAVRTKIEDMSITLNKGFSVFKNGLSAFVGEVDKALGVSSGLGRSLKTAGLLLVGLSRGIGADIAKMLSQLKAVSGVILLIGKSIYDKLLKPVVTVIKTVVASIVNSFSAMWAKVKNPVSGVISKLKESFNSFYVWLRGDTSWEIFVGNFKSNFTAISAIATGELGSVFSSLKENMSNLFNAENFSNLDSLIAPVLASVGSIAAYFGLEYSDSIKQVFNSISSYSSSLLSNVSLDLGSYLSVLSSSLLNVVENLDQLGVLSLFNIDSSLLKKSIGELSATVSSFISSFSGNFKVISEELYQMFNDALVGNFKSIIDKVVGYAYTLWPRVSAPIMEFANNIKDIFYNLWDYLVGNSVWPDTILGIAEWASKLWELVSAPFKAFYENTAAFFSDLYGLMSEFFNGTSMTVLATKLVLFGETWEKTIKSIVAFAAGGLIAGAFTMNPMVRLMGAMTVAVLANKDKILEGLGGIWQGMKDLFMRATGQESEGFVVDTIKNSAKDAKAALDAIPVGLAAAMPETLPFLDDLKTLAKMPIDGIQKTLTPLFELQNYDVASVFQAALESFTIGKQEVGKFTVAIFLNSLKLKGYYEGVKKSYETLTASKNTLLTNLQEIVTSSAPWFSQFVDRSMNLGTAVYSAFNGIRSAFDQSYQGFKANGQSSGEAFLNAFEVTLSANKNIFVGFLDEGFLIFDEFKPRFLELKDSVTKEIEAFVNLFTTEFYKISGINVWEAVKAPFEQFSSNLKTLFYDLWDYLVGNSVWPDTIDGIINEPKNLWSRVGDSFISLRDNTVGVFDNIKESVNKTFGKEIFKPVVDQVNNLDKSLIKLGASLSVAYTIFSTSGFLKIAMFNRVLLASVAIVVAYRKEIMDSLSKVVKWFTGSPLETLKSSFTSTYDYLSSLIQRSKAYYKWSRSFGLSITQSVVGTVKFAAKDVYTKVSALFVTIGDFLGELGSVISNKVSSGWSTVKPVLEMMGSYFVAGGTSFINTVSKGIGYLLSVLNGAISSIASVSNSLITTISSMFLQAYDEQFSKSVFVTLTGIAALLSTRIRSFVFDRLKGVLLTAILPVLNNTYTMQIISLWAQGLIGLVSESITGVSAKQFSPAVNNFLAEQLFEKPSIDETTLQLYLRSINNIFAAIGLGLAGALANQFKDRFEREVDAAFSGASFIFKAGKVQERMMEFASGYAKPLGNLLAVGIAAALVPPIRRAIISSLGFAFSSRDIFQGFRNARRRLGGGEALRGALVRTLGALFLGMNLGKMLSKYLEIDPTTLSGNIITVATGLGTLIASRFLWGMSTAIMSGQILGAGPNAGLIQTVNRWFRSLFLLGLAGSFVFSDVGDMITSSLMDSLGMLDFYRANESIVDSAIVLGLTFGSSFVTAITGFMRRNPVGALIAFASLGEMTAILGDQTYIGGLIKESGFGDIVSSNLIDGIAAGFLAKGFSKKIRAAIALGVAGTETAVEAVAGEGSGIADIVSNGLNAGLATLVVTKNPYAAVGVAIATGIYTGLDDEWKARINNWAKQAADLFVSAFEAQTWVDAATMIGSGWDSLSSTVNSVIDRIIAAKNALLEFLGINKKTYVSPDQVSTPQEYINARQVVQERINEANARKAQIDADLATQPYNTEKAAKLRDEKFILEAELVKLLKDNKDLTFGPAGRFIGILAGQRENDAIRQEGLTSAGFSAAAKSRLELEKIFADPNTNYQDKTMAIGDLIDKLNSLNTDSLTQIETTLQELGAKRNAAVSERDYQQRMGATGNVEYYNNLIKGFDSQAAELIRTREFIKTNLVDIDGLVTEAEVAQQRYYQLGQNWIVDTGELQDRVNNNLGLNTQEFLDQTKTYVETTNNLRQAGVQLDIVGTKIVTLIQRLENASSGNNLPSQAPANRKPGTPFATGGWVSGPGTGTSDSIPAMLSNGEYVINAASTRKFLPFLQAINAGKVPKFNTGGLAGAELQARIDRMDGPSYGSTTAGKAATLSIKVKELNITLPEGYKFEPGLDPTSTRQSAALSGLGSGSSMLQGLSLSALEMMGAVSRVGDGTTEGAGTSAGTGTGKGDGKPTKKKGTFGWYSEQFEKLGKSIDPTILGEMNKAEIESAFATATRIDKLTKERDAMIAGSVQQVKATTELEMLNQQLDNLGQKSTLMQDAFKENFASFLKGQQSFSEMVHGVLDTLTSTIIDKFSQAFTNNLFEVLGLDEMFDNLFSTIFSSMQSASMKSSMGSGFFGNIIAGISGLSGNWLGGFATGGYVSGPGTGTSDSILAKLSNGEYVMNAATTKRWLPFLESINSNDGRLPAFASGGLVGPSNPGAFKTMNENSNKDKQQQVFNINVTGDVSTQTRKEIARMIPEITSGVNMTNRERGSR